jgi:hypothetical protein
MLKYCRNIEGYILDLFGLELPNFPADVTIWWVQLMSRIAELLCTFAADSDVRYHLSIFNSKL